MHVRPRRARRRRGRSGAWRQHVLGIALIIGVVTVVAAGSFFYFNAAAGRVELDQETLCPVEGPHTVTVVLVDRTDPYTPVQQTAIQNALELIRTSVPKHGSLELYAVGPTDQGVLELFARICNPGRGDEINPLIGNPRRVEQRWREGFTGPLDALFARLLQPGEAATSPILESIQSVALTSLAQAPDGPKRLVLISDMLQHTEDVSHYRGELDFAAFKASPRWRRLRPDLDGVEVEILYAWRDTTRNVQGESHVKFWRDAITEAGGRLVRVEALAG